MKDLLDVFGRLLKGLLYVFNYRRKVDAVDDPAATIANGDRVQHSKQSFADLADRSGSDKTE